MSTASREGIHRVRRIGVRVLLLLPLAALAVVLYVWLTHWSDAGTTLLDIELREASQPDTDQDSSSHPAETSNPARELAGRTEAAPLEIRPRALEAPPRGSFRIVDLSRAPIAALALEFRVEGELRFTRASDRRGLVSLAGVPPDLYDVNARDDDVGLLQWSTRDSRPERNNVAFDVFSTIEIELENQAPKLFEQDLLASHVAVTAFRVLGDTRLSSKFVEAELEPWLPDRLREKLRRTTNRLRLRFADAVIYARIPVAPLPPDARVAVEILSARMRRTVHRLPIVAARDLREPTIVRFEPGPERRCANLRIDVLGPRGQAVQSEGIELAIEGMDLPWIPIVAGKTHELPPASYFVHCSDPLLLGALRREFPAKITLRVGEPVRRSIALAWAAEPTRIDIVGDGSRVSRDPVLLQVDGKRVAIFAPSHDWSRRVLVPTDRRLDWWRGGRRATTPPTRAYGGRLRIDFSR